MLYFLGAVFLSLVVYIWIGEMPNAAYKINNKYKIHILDIISSFIGGIIFSIIPSLFVTGASNYGTFDIGRSYLNNYRWSNNLDEFIFGFILTYIIIFVRRSYKK